MLKHQELISKLSDSQKVYMLTSAGSLTGKDMKILDIPEIKCGDMKDYCRKTMPNSTALSHAWDRDVWHSVSLQKSKQMIDDKVNFVLTNGPKIKISPYRREISEDPYLAYEFSNSMLSGANEMGVYSGALGLYLTDSDIDWMDITPDERVINEMLIRPFATSVIKNKSSCLVVDLRHIAKDYQKSCYSSLKNVLSNQKFTLCKKATDENTVKFISDGIICLEGSKNALESAIARYKKIQRSIEMNEGATQEMLDSEIANLSAISLDTIDKSVDILIDFIYTCTQIKPTDKAIQREDDIAYISTVNSSVLLKNNGCLPLKHNSRIAVIGDIFYNEIENVNQMQAFCEGLKDKGYTCIGCERGYKMNDVHNAKEVTNALNLAYRADTILVFLGMGYEQEKLVHKTKSLTLPANQLFLVKKLVELNKNVIGIVSSGQSIDVEFSRSLNGLVYAPLEVKYSAKAILSLLTGENDFSGRLAYTLYSGSDVAFAKRQYYKAKQNAKSGIFIGYRYYDTANLTLGYPFGYGLSYTCFEYTSLTVESNKATVYVQNVGQVAGVETVQLYVGFENSNVLRPKKELCGFEKVYLLPGEKKKVEINFQVPKIYNDNKFVVEGGTYTLSVGSAIDNIHLTTTVYKNGAQLKKDNLSRADYLQSKSNVVSDNYTLEANYKIMKMSIRNILFGILFVLIAISLAVFNAVSEIQSLFVNIVAGTMSVVAVIFFVSEVIERNSQYKEEREKIDQANKEIFKDAEEISVLSSQAIFAEEFAVEDEEDKFDDVVVETISESDMLEFVDKDFKFNNAVEDIKLFYLTRGYKLNNSTSENLVASLASSKLLLTQGIPHEDFNKFIILLAEYLGTPAFIDIYNENEDSKTFFSTDYHGDYTKKGLFLALEYATDNPDKLVVACLDGANPRAVEEYVASFYKYLNFSKPNNKIIVKLENGSTLAFNITNNFRLFINLNEETSIETLPENIVRVSSVNLIDYTITLVEDLPSSHFDFNKYQLDYILEKEGKDASLLEESWKKIDKLVKYANNYTAFKIPNKTWLSLEKYLALLLSLGLSVDEVLDIAVGSKIIPSMSSALKDKLGDEDKSLFEYVEFALGEQKADYSKKLIQDLIIRPTQIKLQNAKKQMQVDTRVEDLQEDVVITDSEVDAVVADLEVDTVIEDLQEKTVETTTQSEEDNSTQQIPNDTVTE